MYRTFKLDMPQSLDDALNMLGNGSAAVPLAGGTNLLVDLRANRLSADHLVSLDKVQELKGICCQNGSIEIGGRASVSDLLRSPEIAEGAPALAQAAKVFAGQMVRNAATVGGNIACGSPAADLVPPLLALDADIELTSTAGRRRMGLAEFFLGYKKDARRQGELITRIGAKRLPANSVNTFYKLARRKGDAVTVVGVAVTLTVEQGRCARARIALGAVAPTVYRAVAAEEMLEGETLSTTLIDAAALQAADSASPIDDIRASAEYRRHGVHVLTRRLIAQAWDRLT
jgi:CO/xanthine dehydrogenase FAD-binding subunit